MKIMGNLDTREGQTAYPIIQSMIPWTEKLYDMTDDEIDNYKSAFREEYHADKSKEQSRETVDIFYIEYKYYQIRKDDKWVQEQFLLSGDKAAVRREILLERLRGSKDSPISPDDIEFLIQNIKPSTDLLIDGKWRFLVYEHGVVTNPGMIKKLFDEKIPYIIGIDPAGGEGGDNTAITIVNPNNLQIAAEFKNPYITAPALERMLIKLVREYIPNAVLIPERNSMGIFLIQHLTQSSIRENLYWSEHNKQLEKLAEENPEIFDLKLQSSVNKKYGTFLSKKVRDAMIQLLFKHINECKELLTTAYLVDDICKLVRTSTGRIEAAQNAHDDSLFSYLHAIYLYYTGDNLSTFGIDNSFLNTVDDPNLEVDESLAYNILHSTKDITFEDIVVQNIIENEEKSKYLMSKFNFVSDPNYEQARKLGLLESYETSIPASFFDEINGF